MLKHDLSWAKAGHSAAFDQFLLPWKKEAQQVDQKKLPPVTISTNNESTLILIGKNFNITLDKETGLITNWIGNGMVLISGSGLKPSFWRPQTDNDCAVQKLTSS